MAIALSACAAVLAAAIRSDPFNPNLMLLAALSALGAWMATRTRTHGPFEVGVSSIGEITVRERGPQGSDGSESRSAATVQLAFASPWLISLRRGTMLVAIWPDSLPQSTYRQLWVHLRWGRAMADDNPTEHAGKSC